MQIRSLLPILFVLCLACSPVEEDMPEIRFEQEKWLTKKGKEYPYRDQMVGDVLYNDTIRSLSKEELVALLGKPDRVNEGHLYYLIWQKKMAGVWPLSHKSLVVKLTEKDSIEWIKLYE